MTTRTLNPATSPIERATQAIEQQLDISITTNAALYGVDEAELRRIIAGYFERKSLRDWMHDLRVIPRETDDTGE